MNAPALVLLSLTAACLSAPALADHTRNILLTGYWPPTNDMLRQFSPDPARNPGGWVGRNWEGRGYNIYAYFPEFPNGPGQGLGDFEIDYQDTAADWARITAELRPVAIITFSRDASARSWELEPAHQRFRLPGEPNRPDRAIALYGSDYSGVRFPTDVPIAAEPLGQIRESSLPMQAIVDAVADQINASQLEPFVPPFNLSTPETCDFGGPFLSGYIGYLGVWRQNLHSAPDSPARCVSAGHIHVGMGVNTLIAAQAVEISLRVLTDHVTDSLPFCLADFNRDGTAGSQDFFDFIAAFFLADPRADFNADGSVTSQDFFDFLTSFFTGCP